MIVIGIDAHKRTHTAVVADQKEASCRREPFGPPARTIWRCCDGARNNATIACGRSRTAGT